MEKVREYISIEKSIIDSLIEVRDIQAGRLPKKTWREFLAELREEDEQEKHNANLINAQL